MCLDLDKRDWHGRSWKAERGRLSRSSELRDFLGLPNGQSGAHCRLRVGEIEENLSCITVDVSPKGELLGECIHELHI